MAPIELCLQYPISANQYWTSWSPIGSKRVMVHPSTPAKAYKKDVALQCRLAGITTPIQGRIEISVWLFPGRPKDWERRKKKDPLWDNGIKALDLDNCLKVLLDSLKGIAFEDDKMVFQLWARKEEPDDEGQRVIVRIEPWVRESPDPFADVEETNKGE